MHMLHEPKLSALDLNLLVVLSALLEERHVTRAASRVGLSQSGLVQLIDPRYELPAHFRDRAWQTAAHHLLASSVRARREDSDGSAGRRRDGGAAYS